MATQRNSGYTGYPMFYRMLARTWYIWLPAAVIIYLLFGCQGKPGFSESDLTGKRFAMRMVIDSAVASDPALRAEAARHNLTFFFEPNGQMVVRDERDGQVEKNEAYRWQVLNDSLVYHRPNEADVRMAFAVDRMPDGFRFRNEGATFLAVEQTRQ